MKKPPGRGASRTKVTGSSDRRSAGKTGGAMKLSTRGRGAATLLAIGTVVLAFAGSADALAAHHSSGDKLIAKHSLSGNRIRNNSLTGKQIKESTLGTVPNATKADGFIIDRIFFAKPPDTSPSPILNADGLVLKAGCSGSAPTLTATAPNSDFHIDGVGDGTAHYGLDESTAFTLSMLDGHDEGSLTADYATSNGHTITLSLAYDRASTFGDVDDCTVFGTALIN
jgi:hypothetical protein